VKYLFTIAAALVEVQNRKPFILRVVGANFRYDGLLVECLPWNENEEVKFIQSFDIGIMPLDCSPWEQGKCGYKLIQYMACGVPVIGSPVGINVEIIQQDVGGVLAIDNDSWMAALNILLDSPTLRRRYGASARDIISRNYSQQSAIERIETILKKMDL
jgi:glycosyltransferase involved in cell wall biosynthesis